jgi:hypothetical protein
MSRLPVTESSKEQKVAATLTSVTTERNRLMSWPNPVQGLTKPGGVAPSSKSTITLSLLAFVSNTTKSILAALVTLPYSLFKLGYEIAKVITRGLSRVRRLLFVAK